MATLTVYNLEGKETGSLKVSDKVFGVKLNADLLYQVVMWYRTNRRHTIAHTKTKGEVRGGGRKPWAQKGTGRARHGSIRGPQWRGGGIVHGPRNQTNYSLQIPVKMRRKALAMTLSDKVNSNELIVVEDMKLAEGKTKLLTQTLNALPVKYKSVILATAAKDQNVLRASRNLQKVETTQANSLNAEQVLKHKFVVMDKESVKILEKQLA